MQYIDIVIKEG